MVKVPNGLRPVRRTRLGRLSNASVTQAEVKAMATLAAAGVPVAEIARLANRDRRTVANTLKTARETLEEKAVEYAVLHHQAACVAAEKGDARPAEWALERLKVVESPKASDGGGGVKINIGVLLPGLPQPGTMPQLVASSVVDAEVE